ncbi:MAG TPA: alkaline phosphatase D family protein [Polyangiales bacterium]|nr:alkaline phosphatase D family protein [Polyangiales bacterium]
MTVDHFARAFPFGEPAGCSTGTLIQLGLPSSSAISIWYARGVEEAAPSLRAVRKAGREQPLAQVEQLAAGACGWVQIAGLTANTSYEVELQRADGRRVTLHARTAPTDPHPFSFLAFSCFAPFAPGRRRVSASNRRTLAALARSARRPSDARPAFALGMGDQVYVDDGALHFRAPQHSLLAGKRLAYPAHEADAYFDKLYRAHFSLAPFDSTLAAIPAALIWDDRELRAGWGTLGDEAHPRWQLHAERARAHFLSYQLLRSARCFEDRGTFERVASLDGRWDALHYSFDWGPRTSVFVMDQRSQRGAGQVLGDAQTLALEAWLRRESREPQLFVLVSPVPLTTPGWFRLDPAGRTRDRLDRWWAEPNRDEAQRLLTKLVERFGRSRDRLLILSGDVHYSDVRELRLPNGGALFGHELISSGLAQSSYQAWQRPFYELDEWRPAFPDVLSSTSLGRHLGSGFAELHVTPEADGTSLRVLFHFGDSRRELELSRHLGKRKPPLFELDPSKHGALLALKPRSPAAESPTQVCLRAHGPDRVRAAIALEREFIEQRKRDETASSQERALERPLSGLALSGGGIRSATTCIGFMQVLQQAGQLASFDYASSVSGGSFANGYLQVMGSPAVRARMQMSSAKPLDDAFSDDAIERLYANSSYLARGTGLTGAFNMVRLLTSFSTSLIQHWLWLGSVLVTLGYAAQLADPWLRPVVIGMATLGGLTVLARMAVAHGMRRSLEDGLNRNESALAIGLLLLGVPLLWKSLPERVEALFASLCRWVAAEETDLHAIAVSTGLALLLSLSLSVLWKRDLMLRTRLQQGLIIGGRSLAGVFLALGVAWLLQHAYLYMPFLTPLARWLALAQPEPWWKLCLSGLVTAFLTLITSPNSTSLHRYYAARLDDTFLQHGRAPAPLLLRDLVDPTSQAPYPLFNGCVNLVGKDPEFAGDQTSDYFLFAPHHCGSKLLGYARTGQGRQYGRLSLATAVTCSGAAISPFQGRSMPSATSLFMWLLNLRTDLWLANPGQPRTGFWARILDPHTLPWGPLHQLLALSGKLDTRSRFVNVSDGGFIDNLGVYELLRRRCQRIVAVDATWDTHYEFEYLRNLVVRARQELGIDFEFEEQPEDVIKPRVTDGLSAKCVLLARIKWPAHEQRADGKLFYVKAALSRQGLRATSGQKAADPSRAYATYHPSFPQESTGDQFFDPVQSRAYHELGRHLAHELLAHHAFRKTPTGARPRVVAAAEG